MRLLLLAFVVAFPAPVRAEWALMIEGKIKHTYPDEASSACPLDKASWKWVHPDDRTECRKIKGKTK